MSCSQTFLRATRGLRLLMPLPNCGSPSPTAARVAPASIASAIQRAPGVLPGKPTVRGWFSGRRWSPHPPNLASFLNVRIHVQQFRRTIYSRMLQSKCEPGVSPNDPIVIRGRAKRAEVPTDGLTNSATVEKGVATLADAKRQQQKDEIGPHLAVKRYQTFGTAGRIYEPVPPWVNGAHFSYDHGRVPLLSTQIWLDNKPR